jgi:hypothetical protein
MNSISLALRAGSANIADLVPVPRARKLENRDGQSSLPFGANSIRPVFEPTTYRGLGWLVLDLFVVKDTDPPGHGVRASLSSWFFAHFGSPRVWTWDVGER